MSSVVTEVNIHDIDLSDSVYPRVRPDYKLIWSYAAAMRAGAVFPPITVATIEGALTLIDGRHRIGAAKVNEVDTIRAENLGRLSRRAAFLLAIDRNIRNGLALRPADKRWVRSILSEGFKLGDRKVAQVLQMTVETMHEWEAEYVGRTEGDGASRTKAVTPHHLDRSGERISLDEQVEAIDLLLIAIRNGSADWGVVTLNGKYGELRKVLNERMEKTTG